MSAARLLSMTMLSTGLAVGAGPFGARPARAQSAAAQYSVNVGDTGLADGLRQLQRSTGAKLIFSPDQLRALRTRGVTGTFTVEEALKRLLEGTGFEAQETGPATFVIVETRASVAPAPKPQLVPPAPAPAPPAPQRTEIEEGIPEIIVTAQRREENLQRVPLSMRALTTQTIEQQQVEAFDDYAKLLPSVSFKTLGPGRSDIFFRGISTGASGLLPTSGMYLDEIPVTTGGRALDIHLYDIARVEALSGPQGTLFGASSLAGTLRIITNKPDPSHFAAGVDVQGDWYGDGGPGGMFEGFANIPLGNDAAVRLVGFYKKDGGYIDNKPASLTYQLGDGDPNTKLTTNNSALVKNDFNPVETYGGRIAAIIGLNDRWSLTPQLLYQAQDAKGSFLYDPRVGDLAVHDFGPTRNRDRWIQAALTIQGQVGVFDLIYSGGYLSRGISNDNDYTYYTVAYDRIPGYTNFPDGHGGFLDPTQRYHANVRSYKQTHELRVSTWQTGPLQFSGGLFYQRSDTYNFFNYYVPGLGALHNPITVYGDDVFLIYTHSYNLDYAAFAEAGYKITPDLTFTAGLRGFSANVHVVGFTGVPRSARLANCAVPLLTPDGCVNRDQRVDESGETHRFNLNWQIDKDRMVYAIYSTGFRPGGPNNQNTVRPYRADTLDNYEIGFKTTWFGRLRVNGAAYFEQWNGLQYRLVSPGNNGQIGTYNAGQAHVYGAEVDGQWRVNNGLTVSFSAAYNDARLSKDLCNLDSTFNPVQTCAPGPTMAAPKGTRLPSQPALKFAGTARYDFPLAQDWQGFVQGSVQYQGATRSYLSIVEDRLLGDTPSFAAADFSIGARQDGTTVELFIQNAFDVRGQLSRNTFCAIKICSGSSRTYPIKPQFFGIKAGRRF